MDSTHSEGPKFKIERIRYLDQLDWNSFDLKSLFAHCVRENLVFQHNYLVRVLSSLKRRSIMVPLSLPSLWRASSFGIFIQWLRLAR